ncbi:hypothetical protein MarSH_042 [Marseillevirus Shanghai 1]|nr:hypothetical protein MarSH_042 [Marseillevirus Shanghai 1]
MQKKYIKNILEMNETQKEVVVQMLTKAWSIHNIPPSIEKGEDGKIRKIRFLMNGRDLIYPLCWCFSQGCEDCETTRVKEDDERIRCRMTCSKIRKCYLCA